MAKQARRSKHPALRATFWFVLVMLPSWWVLLFSGCSFQTNPDPHHDIWGRVIDDADGGE
jgi:hypothetical protein